MNDNVLNAGFLALIVSMALAAGASLQPVSRHAGARVADMPVVTLPAVVVVGKRQASADTVVAKAGLPVVQLPAVEVTGRRVPAMETLTLARAE